MHASVHVLQKQPADSSANPLFHVKPSPVISFPTGQHNPESQTFIPQAGPSQLSISFSLFSLTCGTSVSAFRLTSHPLLPRSLTHPHKTDRCRRALTPLVPSTPPRGCPPRGPARTPKNISCPLQANPSSRDSGYHLLSSNYPSEANRWGFPLRRHLPPREGREA